MKKYYNYICIILFVFVSGCSSNMQNNLTSVDVDPKISPPAYNKQQLEVTTLEGKITSSKNLVSQFKKIGYIKPKSEFETDSDFDSRKAQFEENERFKKTYFALADKSFSLSDSIKYNPDTRRFDFKTSPYTARIPNGFASFEILPFVLLLDSKYTQVGSYTGANAFGVTAKVIKWNDNYICINATNTNCMLKSSHVNRVSSHPTEVNGVSRVIDPKKAELISKNLSLAFEFTPSVHYIDEDKFGAVAFTKEYSSPTISDPNESTKNKSILFVNLVAVHLIDTSDLAVYGSVYLE